MKKIKLTKGYSTLVDDEYFEWLSQWKWCARTDKYGNVYADRAEKKNGISKHFSMHRMILNAPKGMQVDHADGDGLNNQRSNIRLCSHGENIHNQKKSSRNTSGFKGAFYISRDKKWQSIIRKDGVIYRLGFFKTAKEAGDAYKEAAKILYGEFARLKP